MATVLEDIVAARRTHLPAIRERIGNPSLTPSTRSLYDSLQGNGRIIMECKSASPSLGTIRSEYNPGELARIYSRYAAGISVLCEPERFGGDYDHLATVAASTHLPVLCKDFIVDEVQVRAARHYGADAILLMMSVLSDAEYAQLKALADSLNLDVLTEAITEEEIARAVRLGARIIGINNRNLHDLSIDLTRTERLAPLIPEGVVTVSESGITDNQTVRRLPTGAFLVGSHLAGQDDVDRAARELLYGSNKVCGLTSPSSAQAARAAGAVYGGLIFAPESPRCVSRETAEAIMAAEPELTYVAVTRGEPIPGFINQLHAPYQGSLEAELDYIGRAKGPVWRAIDMTRNPDLAELLVEHVDMLVLDSGGGTGVPFDWQSVPDAVKQRSLLAGGIGMHNLTDALRVGTAGLDLNSGLEYAPGRKDSGLMMKAFDTIKDHK